MENISDQTTHTFQELKQVLPYMLQEEWPIMLRGLHGIGKSEIVYQVVQNDLGMEVIERRASQMTEGDLLGLPAKGAEGDDRKSEITQKFLEELDANDWDDVDLENDEWSVDELRELRQMAESIGVEDSQWTEFLPPKWLYIASTKGVGLFIDELDRATKEVRQGFFELGDSRKIYGQELHEDTRVFAACNSGPGDGKGYQTLNLDPAEADRWSIIDLKPTQEEWLDWAEQQGDMPSEIAEFIADHPEHLEAENFEPGKRYPSRRSWYRLGTVLQNAEPFQNTVEEENFTDQRVRKIAQAYVGPEAANQFDKYLKDLEKNLNPMDIVDGGQVDQTRNWSAPEHNSLIKKFRSKETFLDLEITEERGQNIAEYMILQDPEQYMLLFQEFVKTIPYNLKNYDDAKKEQFKNVYHAEVDNPRGEGTVTPRERIVNLLQSDQGEDVVESVQEELEDEQEDDDSSDDDS